MGPRRVVENLRNGTDHVFVVVEDLMVVTAESAMALHEDLVRRVDHDFPDIVIGEKGTEGLDDRARSGVSSVSGPSRLPPDLWEWRCSWIEAIEPVLDDGRCQPDSDSLLLYQF